MPRSKIRKRQGDRIRPKGRVTSPGWTTYPFSAERLELVPRTGYTVSQETLGGGGMKTATIRARTEPGLKADVKRQLRMYQIATPKVYHPSWLKTVPCPL